jgi:hypothetical protein
LTTEAAFSFMKFFCKVRRVIALLQQPSTPRLNA